MFLDARKKKNKNFSPQRTQRFTENVKSPLLAKGSQKWGTRIRCSGSFATEGRYGIDAHGATGRDITRENRDHSEARCDCGECRGIGWLNSVQEFGHEAGEQ